MRKLAKQIAKQYNTLLIEGTSGRTLNTAQKMKLLLQ